MVQQSRDMAAAYRNISVSQMVTPSGIIYTYASVFSSSQILLHLLPNAQKKMVIKFIDTF
jgi:hypothetical protein